jgi:hypothetical protein
MRGQRALGGNEVAALAADHCPPASGTPDELGRHGDSWSLTERRQRKVVFRIRTVRRTVSGYTGHVSRIRLRRASVVRASLIAGSAATLAVTGIVPRVIEIPLIVLGSILAGAPGLEFVRVKDRPGRIRTPVFSM